MLLLVYSSSLSACTLSLAAVRAGCACASKGLLVILIEAALYYMRTDDEVQGPLLTLATENEKKG